MEFRDSMARAEAPNKPLLFPRIHPLLERKLHEAVGICYATKLGETLLRRMDLTAEAKRPKEQESTIIEESLFEDEQPKMEDQNGSCSSMIPSSNERSPIPHRMDSSPLMEQTGGDFQSCSAPDTAVYNSIAIAKQAEGGISPQ